MAYEPLTPLPGVCMSDSAYTNSIKQAYANGKPAVGRFTNMLNARFIAGMPEKLGGYALNITTQLTGICRGAKDFRDFSQNIYCAFGTNLKLQLLSNGALLDITPYRVIVTGTLTNPLTTNGTTTVEVAHTAHGLKTGDYVQLTSGTVVDNIFLANTYYVTVIDADNYTITVPTAATGSTSGGGGTVTYVYYRIVLTDPFSTTIGSKVVVVTQTDHGAQTGDYVNFSGATAYEGITINGEYQIQGTTVNTYTILAANNATGTGASGGGTVSVVYDISIGNVNTGSLFGYGIGPYSGNYGYSQSPTSSNYFLTARVWCLDNYGQQLLACPTGGQIYVWDPIIQGRASPLYGSPNGIQAMFVTAERFVMALGQIGNLLEVEWPDQSNYTNWIAGPTNTANSRTVQIGSYLVGGVSCRDGTSIAVTNTCAYAFNYSGNQYVYDSTSTGRNTGLVGPLAICSYASDAYWMGPNEFWHWNGTVQPLPSDDIRDYVYKNINKQQFWKCFAVPNTAKKEVIFYYCSASSSEIDSSVTFHTDQNCWSINKIVRTSRIDATLFEYPLSTDVNGNIYNEEFGTDANGTAMDSYIVLSPMVISKGDRNLDLVGFLPDFERLSQSATLTVNTQNYPEDPLTTFGPYILTANDSAPLNDLRIGTRLVGYKIESNVIGGDYRIGLPQVDIYQAGARR